MSEILLVDMDGVIADAVGQTMVRAEQDGFNTMAHADLQDYWFTDSPVPGEQLLDYMREPGFFTSLDAITGAVRGVNRLREQYDVRVCTAPMPGTRGDPELEKRLWLEHHFDTDFAADAIVTQQKDLVNAKAIIEDNPNIKVPYQPIMFHQRYNRMAMHYPRMFNWGDLDVVDRVMRSK